MFISRFRPFFRAFLERIHAALAQRQSYVLPELETFWFVLQYTIASGGATVRTPRLVGYAHRQNLKEDFHCIKEKDCNLLAKYFCILRNVQALKMF
jgi:hypothetical protein